VSHAWAVLVLADLTADQAQAVAEGGMPRLASLRCALMDTPQCRLCAAPFSAQAAPCPAALDPLA